MLDQIVKFSVMACCGLALAACGDDETSTPAAVAVTVMEFSVSASPSSAKSGDVKFNITNTGTKAHEFVVFKTDLAHDQLPVMDAAVNEEAPGVEAIDEIEDILPGATQSLTLNLKAANYVLVCNKVVPSGDSGVISHYMNGMHTPFMVH